VSESVPSAPPVQSTGESAPPAWSPQQSFAHLSEHQQETLRVHEQYLDHQAEFARTFLQFMSQQQALLLDERQSTLPPDVLDSMNRSATMLYEHQVETLQVHKQYLNSQGEYTRSMLAMLQQQPMLSAPAAPAAAVYTDTAEPQSPPTPAAEPAAFPAEAPVAPQPEPAASPEPEAVPEAPAAPTFSFDAFTGSPPAPQQPAPQPVQPPQPAQPAAHHESGNGANGTPTTQPTVDTAHLDQIAQSLLNVVSEKTGYPVEMLEPDMDMESDLGIDSIKRVEILGAMQDLYPDLPRLKAEELAELRTLGQIGDHMLAAYATEQPAAPAAPPAQPPQPAQPAAHHESGNGNGSNGAPAAQPTVDTAHLDQIAQSLLNVVSEKTGYPVEMLEPDMDMESDLGIDSIKRVEILGAMQDLYPDLPRLKAEELAELRTLGQIGDHMLAAYATEQPAAPQQPAPEVAAPAAEPEQSGVPRRVARIKPLPEPDMLDIGLPQGYSCLLTDDGTALTSQLAQTLHDMGWKVVVLSFPQSLIAAPASLPAHINRISLRSLEEPHLAETLQSIAATYGPAGAFIHLHPPVQANSQQSGVVFSETEKAITRHVFLMSKYLQQPLNAAAQQQRGYFVTVARLDGEFGLGQSADFGAVGGGLFGLTKSLNLEWEPVFCRAIDIGMLADPDQAVRSIIAELRDPNRLITEVGYGSQGRSTLVAV
jgi:acyl carrier protein